MPTYNRFSLSAVKISAFTLAEVLITLGIIGVVSMMTIPNLIQSTQDRELKTSWKEIYSQISQATNLIIADNNGTLVGVCDTSDGNTDLNLISNSDCMMALYAEKLKTMKTYTYQDSTDNNIAYYQLGGSYNGKQSGSRLYLTNGAVLALYRFNNSNSAISVDVNGDKGPNVIGKDMFYLWIFPNAIKPAGWPGETQVARLLSTCNKNGTGWGCSAKYLYGN